MTKMSSFYPFGTHFWPFLTQNHPILWPLPARVPFVHMLKHSAFRHQHVVVPVRTPPKGGPKWGPSEGSKSGEPSAKIRKTGVFFHFFAPNFWNPEPPQNRWFWDPVTLESSFNSGSWNQTKRGHFGVIYGPRTCTLFQKWSKKWTPTFHDL